MINGIQVKTKREKVREKVIFMIKQNKLRIGDRILSDNQLAKLCKVSPLTANRVLVGMEHEGILSRIKGKGTFIRRNPAQNQTTNIALVFGEENFSNPEVNKVNWHIVKGIHESLLSQIGKSGKVSTVIYSDGDPAEAVRTLQEYNVVFFVGYSRYVDLINQLTKKTHVPVMVLVEKTDTQDCFNIYTDIEVNAATAATHLASHGYQRIGYIGSTPRGQLNKLHGFKMELAKWGLSLDEKRIVLGIDSQSDGAKGASVLYNRGFDCDAVFIDTDLKAVNAIEFFNKVGVRVPEDLALISYDGLEPYISGYPYLTSVNIDYGEMIHMAFERIKKNNFLREKIIGQAAYRGKLVIGRTCGCNDS